MPTDELTLDQIDDADPRAPRQLREFAERAQARANAADGFRKENQALRAGIDVTTKLGQAWLRTTEADFDNAEALVKDAAEFHADLVKPRGFDAPAADPATGDPSNPTGTAPVTASATPPAPEPTGTAQRRALADGATPSAAATQDPREAALARAEELRRTGVRSEEAMGEAIALQARAVAEGRIQAIDAFGRPIQAA